MLILKFLQRNHVQDVVVIHGLETIDEQGKSVENNLVAGSDGKKYAVDVGERVSLAHQS
jgi:carbonic anhydrase/acetyltransferase-like protein (isoleucine patch superfamily)